MSHNECFSIKSLDPRYRKIFAIYINKNFLDPLFLEYSTEFKQRKAVFSTNFQFYILNYTLKVRIEKSSNQRKLQNEITFSE